MGYARDAHHHKTSTTKASGPSQANKPTAINTTDPTRNPRISTAPIAFGITDNPFHTRPMGHK